MQLPRAFLVLRSANCTVPTFRVCCLKAPIEAIPSPSPVRDGRFNPNLMHPVWSPQMTSAIHSSRQFFHETPTSSPGPQAIRMRLVDSTTERPPNPAQLVAWPWCEALCNSFWVDSTHFLEQSVARRTGPLSVRGRACHQNWSPQAALREASWLASCLGPGASGASVVLSSPEQLSRFRVLFQLQVSVERGYSIVPTKGPSSASPQCYALTLVGEKMTLFFLSSTAGPSLAVLE
ncbi:hypothetical protein B0T26DRAFT_512771 [Lasiosphaeria miniovina]|uniref:Uncharacterized protein n=1 Tax=Lasiosphaeria miniovina TaxID=1954250 RepID=A0AA40DK57_9PEZI|nr:uncharacterized protein B0T26DRAFT_512771 [Lasiosphaeria miniovina]KAK0703792.1 hypothetical protein B0T26DRAFT_512771 [Lasiosphaeria miniovina]